MSMIEVVCNDRLGFVGCLLGRVQLAWGIVLMAGECHGRRKVRVKCNSDDTVGDLKKLIAAQTGTRPEKIRLQKWHTIYKDHITLEVRCPSGSKVGPAVRSLTRVPLQDYEVHDGFGFEMFYN